MNRRGVSRFYVYFFLDSQCRNSAWGTFMYFKKGLVWKEIMNRRGVSQFYVEIIWTHSAESLRGEPFCVSKIVWYGKNL